MAENSLGSTFWSLYLSTLYTTIIEMFGKGILALTHILYVYIIFVEE